MKDNNSPVVSIVIGAYNEANMIASTIQSLLGQTVDDFEVIIVDDGSQDETSRVVQEFCDNRVNLIKADSNNGLPASLNRGIESAEGRYIARADADEYSTPSRIQKQRQVLDNNPSISVVGCWYVIIGPNNERGATVQVPEDRSFGVDDLIDNGPGIAHGSVMMRKEAIKQVGGYREEFTLAQDYDLWLRFAEEFGEGWLDIVPEVLYERRVEAGQLEKRELQRLFAETAKKCAKRRRRVGDDARLLEQLSGMAREAETQSFDFREAIGMCHYLQGNHFLEQGNRRASCHRALKAIWLAPTKPRPWYLLLQSSLPNEWRETVQRWSQAIFHAR